jgi:hypothetical protein
MEDPAKPIAIAHRVLAHEDFERTAQILLTLLNEAQHLHPGAERHLILEIQGHRDSKGDFDPDMFELQTKFLADFLVQFLTTAKTPGALIRNPNPQKNEIPESLGLVKFDRPPPGDPDGSASKRRL